MSTVWGQLTILELKLLIYLALGEHALALEHVEMSTIQRQHR